MNVTEIKQAVESGKTVCWENDSYVVVKDKIGQWLIHFVPGDGNYIGLTWRDEVTLNGKEEQFYIKEDK
ncbi:MAG: hypothetical protein PF692_07570 [Kiritimatiellae bacterium]|jgi:hypothetical protein|nr:hypothetical protein [Kiritimatiellia bacterium]